MAPKNTAATPGVRNRAWANGPEAGRVSEG